MKATCPDDDGPSTDDDADEPVRRHLEAALDHAEDETTKFHLREALQLVEFESGRR